MLLEDLGLDSLDYEKYIIKNPFNLLLGDDKVDNPTKKIVEEPLGIYNKRQIDFCLGGSYYNRLKSISQEKK